MRRQRRNKNNWHYVKIYLGLPPRFFVLFRFWTSYRPHGSIEYAIPGGGRFSHSQKLVSICDQYWTYICKKYIRPILTGVNTGDRLWISSSMWSMWVGSRTTWSCRPPCRCCDLAAAARSSSKSTHMQAWNSRGKLKNVASSQNLIKFNLAVQH